MIKRGVLGALLIFDKIFFLSTHIGSNSSDVGLDWSLDVPFSSWISRHHHHVLFEMKEIFLLAMSETTRVKTHKLLQVCKQVVTSLFTSCQQVVFALLVPSLL